MHGGHPDMKIMDLCEARDMGIPEAETPIMARKATAPDFDSQHFKRALSQFATGVTVITTRAAGHPHANGAPFVGITASSFNSVSLDPPLVLWSMATRANSLPMFRDGSHYIINVLAASQLDLCQRFATLKGDRFAGVDYRLSATGLPILPTRWPGSNATTAAAMTKAIT
jgi:flavin reductase (DIM6/NTAB) family NADH-FMN oxidoreductase RutF